MWAALRCARRPGRGRLRRAARPRRRRHPPGPEGVAILSPRSRSTVEATLPVVGAHIGEISERFYLRLFAAVPELGTNLFNRTNQQNKSQQEALASSVAAFATLLVSHAPQDITPIMARIAAKHASLGVQAAQYEVVRTHLFAAIVEVLGSAVTPEVAEAWNEVYTLMANTLVEQETLLYENSGVSPGDVWRPVVVADREYDGAHATTLFLRSVDGSPLPGFLPGQYISVRIRFRDGTEQIRQYTVVRGRVPGEWSLSVKRVSGGLVSPVLVDQVATGHRLSVSLPFGGLVVDGSDAPLLLVSAGIGITNSIAALQHLAVHDPTRRITVLHVEHSPYEHVRRVQFSKLVADMPHARLHVRYTDFDGIREDGRNPLSGVTLDPRSQTYVCGPVDFMRAIRNELVESGLPARSIHYEAFAPGSWLGLEPEPQPTP
ncbi:MAG: oxidoreductase [Rhodococcus sp.]|uniref:globin domain-containing protein n=1 Tax=Rhodococcus TaxID=1827 RepID=UPI0016BB2C16|nr:MULTISPECIES: globin domain-containing protein [Rhodococcus]NLV78394.1 oxidoreductase [Rhodococcus sp. (in: high G+C Gram-positive bacteria)]